MVVAFVYVVIIMAIMQNNLWSSKKEILIFHAESKSRLRHQDQNIAYLAYVTGHRKGNRMVC